MNKNLIIIGAGGFGNEVAWVAKTAHFNVLGFLDDTVKGTNILGKVSDWHTFSQVQFFIAIGVPRVRKKVYLKMLQHGKPEFATIISPVAIIAPDIEIGQGSIVMPGSIISVNSRVGAHVIINLAVTVGHDVILEDFVSINPQSAISGSVVVKQGAEIGTNGTITQGITIGEGALITAGAMIHATIHNNQVAVGNPSRAIQKLDEWLTKID